MLKKLIWVIGLGSVIGFTYFSLLTQPSNSRNWEFGFEVLPRISITNQQVSIENLRNFNFQKASISSDYKHQTVDLNNLETVWFVFEPFKIKPFTTFNGVAHTYFVFDFKDQDPIVVSVEARREKGEKYDAWLGAVNQFELIYVWGTEKDQTIRRVTVENNQLYMYPLTISQAATKQLFLELAKTTQQLEIQPRFYNTFLSNCTNELAKAANRVKSNSIPTNLALFLPGYSVEELYKLGYIPNNQPIEKIKQKHFVSDIIREIYQEASFSALLRQKLQSQ